MAGQNSIYSVNFMFIELWPKLLARVFYSWTELLAEVRKSRGIRKLAELSALAVTFIYIQSVQKLNG